jgi:LysM repeat protein/murein endopeptidase
LVPIALLAVWLAPGLAHAGKCPDGYKAETHEVQDGQTLSKIAAIYNVGYKRIEYWNPGLKPNVIRPGQKLTICKETRKTSSKLRSCGGGGVLHEHVVASGDTLTRIESKYAVSQKSIMRRNPELKDDPNALRIGQTLKICSTPSRARAHKACGNRTPLHKHRVVPGEWLAEIASRYGVRRSDIFKLNPKVKANPDLLRTGDIVLVCPDIAPRERVKINHTVQSGENFGSIALRYGLSRKQLQRFQKGKVTDMNKLREGQKLTVWRDGAILPGYGAYENGKGALPSGMQMPSGKNYVVKHPSLSWGEPSTVQGIQAAISKYRSRTSGGPKVHVGDISKKGGGKFPPHKSHRNGRDVDMGYVLKGDLADEVRFRTANKKSLDVARSWNLVKAFVDTTGVRYIFMDYKVQKLLYEYAKSKGVSSSTLEELFQYPRGKRRHYGVIRHEPGHVNHFHVRFGK